jgi:hypothetical protein
MNPTFAISGVEAVHLLQGLVQVNLSQIKKAQLRKGKYPIIRAIQKGTLRYRRSDPNEHWKTWRELVRELKDIGTATADCEDLSSAVVAELRYNGIEARNYVYKSGSRLFHVVVKTNRWGFLDPSRAAGMETNG